MITIYRRYICTASVRSTAICLLSVVLSSFSLLLTVSCDEAESHRDETLAVEAWIDTDGYPVVLLSRALQIGTEAVDVGQMMVRMAKVSITDGRDTVVMTGGWDYSVFPPYSYRTFAMAGSEGGTYTIIVEVEGDKAQATTTILPAAEITDVAFESNGQGTYSGTLTFTTPKDADTCRFVVYTRVRNKETRHYPAFMGTVSTYKRDEKYEIPLYKGKHTDDPAPFEPNFSSRDTVDVILARVTPVVYDFWYAYNDQVYFADNLFVSSTSMLGGNVDGGYGVFSGRGTSRKIVVVE